MLLLQAKRDALLKPLLAVTGIIERRHTLPILSNILVEKKEDKVIFLATDREIQITTAGTEELTGPNFALTTSAKKLQDILRALPEESQVILEQQDGRLTVKTDTSRFTLQTLPAEDYPLLSVSGSALAQFKLPQHTLKNLISQVQYAMAVQDIRYYLNGLLMQTDGNQIRLIATDGHRLALAVSEIDVTLPKVEVILPRKIILELYKLLTDNDNTITIELLANQVRFSLGGTVIISKVIDSKFPDYNGIIPLDNDKLFIINRLLLLHTLQRAAILANEKFRGVRLVLHPGKMAILCSNSEQEEAEEELEIDYHGDKLEICFNINYLLDVLTNIQVNTLQLAFCDASRSALVTIPDVSHFKYVVMPMRI